MRKLFVHIPVWLLLPLLVSCMTGSMTPGATPTGAPSTQTAAAFTPSPTDTVTPAPTETYTPTATPTPGPPPDLELLNVTIDGDDNLMGEIRNNTDQPMILPPREPAFRFWFEEWQDFGSLTGYYHNIFSPADVEPGDDAYSKVMNCILYPGEKGVIAFDIGPVLSRCEGCATRERIPAPPVKTGYDLIRYESFFFKWEELRDHSIYSEYPAEFGSHYHPSADNLTYRIEGSAIFINFDTNLLLPIYMRGWNFVSWIILYDSNGSIVNILYSLTIPVDGPSTSGNYHIVGVGSEQWSSSWNSLGDIVQWWKPKSELTADALQRVDHIRVLFEINDSFICGDASPNLS
jgi:hypothetical protein